jgi:hypothetical protein
MLRPPLGDLVLRACRPEIYAERERRPLGSVKLAARARRRAAPDATQPIAMIGPSASLREPFLPTTLTSLDSSGASPGVLID